MTDVYFSVVFIVLTLEQTKFWGSANNFVFKLVAREFRDVYAVQQDTQCGLNE